jgi:hypothetical protein
MVTTAMKPKLLLCLALVLSESSIVTHADETNAASSKPEMEMSLSVNGKTNNNTATLDATNSSKDFANSVTTNYEKLILSSTNIVPTNFAAALPMVSEFVRTNFSSILTNSAMAEMSAGVKFLTELKNQGGVPGVLKDSHAVVTGGLHTDDPELSDLKEAKYPFLLTFNVVLTGDSLTNHYTIIRASPDADWQLQRAWRTDTEGNTIKEWPVK